MNQLDIDVVVMGSGAAGLAAALTAAEGGAKVIVFEKSTTAGGISNMGMGIFAAESRLQRQRNIHFTRDEAFRIFMEQTHWCADARLVRAYIDKTASTIEWLEKQGVKFKLLDSYTFPGCTLSGHIIERERVGGFKSEGGRSAVMIKTLIARAEEKGVEIRLGTPVKRILKEDGRITGVIVEEENGDTIQVNTKAVVVASGGYIHNKDMFRQYGEYELGRNIVTFHKVKLTGDGIRLAWEVGAYAEPKGMAAQISTAMPGRMSIGGSKARAIILEIDIIAEQPYLLVNQLGLRFIDEGIQNFNYIGNAIMRQKDHCAYLIIDGGTVKRMEEFGVDHVVYIFPEKLKLNNVDSIINKAIDDGATDVYAADSLAELAGKIGVNADVLQKTVDEYNSFCEKGHDDLFAKDPRYLLPVKCPRFYAFKLMAAAYGTVGGVKVNEKTEVLTKEFEVIPGLYAAGDTANTALSYDFSLAYKLWGSALGFAVNSGRIAGENAVEYIKSVAK
jgi:fumarate reductase flavoprotein subunit